MNMRDFPRIEASQLSPRTALFGRVLAWICTLAVIGAALIAFRVAGYNIGGRSYLSDWAQLGFLGAWLAAFGALIWGLYNGRASFVGFARGELLARRTIAGLRNLALGIFLYEAASVLLRALLVLVARGIPLDTMNLPDLLEKVVLLVSLGAIVLVASVLTQAAEIAEGNARRV